YHCSPCSTRAPPTPTPSPSTTPFRSQRADDRRDHVRLGPRHVRTRADRGADDDQARPARHAGNGLPVLRMPRGSSLVIIRPAIRSEEHTSELQSLTNLVCPLLLETKK